MRILLSSTHRYPAGGRVGAGLRANPRTTGGAAFVHDSLARGLAELGHEVYCHLRQGYDPPLPDGVRYTEGLVRGVDVLHHVNGQFLHVDWPPSALAQLGAAWMGTLHMDATAFPSPPPGHSRGLVPPNWVAVSRSLARAYDHPRVVVNGVDPGQLIYSAAKEDYLLFAGRADVADEKGLGLAFALARVVGVPLTVMASSDLDAVMCELDARCRQWGARFVGDARGPRKAELFAGARALLFPTNMAEGCPLVIAEALMSGTPVIASPRGACPEMVTPGVGFICATEAEYLQALQRIGSIRPVDCRRKALAEFHHIEMARQYVAAYEQEMTAFRSDPNHYLERGLAYLRN
jgi:glycosyltransferase involved in cell wall biosynthesis